VIPLRYRQGAAQGLLALTATVLLLASFSLAQTQSGSPLERRYSEAETFRVAGDLKSAEAGYRDVIAGAASEVAALHRQNGDVSGAVALLRFANAVSPNNATLLTQTAIAYLAASDLTNAKVAAEKAIAIDSHSTEALNVLGKVKFAAGDYAGAATQFEAALAIHAEDFDSAYSLALANLKQNKVGNAGVIFDEMLASMKATPELALLIGNAYRETGHYVQAEASYQRALKLNPKIARAHAYLGKTYLLEGGLQRAADAEREFSAELAANPHDLTSHYEIGMLRLQEHQYGAAQEALKTAAAEQPQDPDTQCHLGEAYSGTGNLQLAIAALQSCTALLDRGAPSQITPSAAHELLAGVLGKAGKTADADREIAAAKAASSKHVAPPLTSVPSLTNASTTEESGIADLLANACNNLGVIRAMNKQYAEAADLFAQAAKWSRNIQNLDRNWGFAAFRASRYNEATAPLEQYVAKNPRDGRARYMLALSYFMTQDYPQAAAIFRPDLDTLPSDPGLLYAAGTSLARSGDAPAAEKIFKRFIEASPNSPEAHLILAEAHRNQKEYDDSLRESAEALRLDTHLAGAHYSRGLVRLRQGKLDDAEAEFRAELASHPDDLNAQYHLGYVLAGKHQSDEAIALLTTVVQRKPDYADAYYELGKVQLERGEVPKAISALETAVRLAPDSEFAYYQLSMAYRRSGREADANAALQKFQVLKAQQRPSPSNVN
jgi:tetratricopeptide (TPR) repeat protein